MRSAPCLVRENTSTDSSAASFSRWTSAGTLAAIETSTTHCVTASTGVDARADLHQRRRLQELLRDPLDLLRHRGREEQRLPRPRRGGDDAADRREKAHVEHAVGFVEHEHLQRRRSRRAAVPSGRSGGRAWPPRCRRRGAAPGSAGLRRRRRRSSRSGAAGGGRRRGRSLRSARPARASARRPARACAASAARRRAARASAARTRPSCRCRSARRRSGRGRPE